MISVVSFVAVAPIACIAVAASIPLLKLFTENRALFNSMLLSAASLLLGASIASLYISSSRKLATYCFGGWPSPLGICYAIDRFNAFIALIFAIVFLVTALYSTWYSRHMDNYVYLYTAMLIHASGLLGLVFTADLFNIYVMLEVVGLSAYAMIASYRRRIKALVASVRYALLGAFYTSLLLLAIVLLYTSLGTLSMGTVAASLHIEKAATLRELVSLHRVENVLFFTAVALWLGLFLSAIFPNHFWLPDAHAEAPTPASALLSGATVLSGFYIVVRVLYTLIYGSALDTVATIAMLLLGALGIVSVLYGVVMLSIEEDVKRLLAYSTILNMGYIYMGLSIGTELGIAAALLHALNHAVGKAMAFLSVGVLVRKYRTRNLYVLEGKGGETPVTTALLTFALLSLIGLPPTGGFFSKLMLFQAFMEVRSYANAAIVVVGTALSVYGYGRILEHLWHPLHELRTHREKERLSLPVLASLIALASIAIVVSIVQPQLSTVLIEAASGLRNSTQNYIDAAIELLQALLRRES